MDHLSASQLYAIQKIAGNTREEKFEEIGRIVRRITEVIKKMSDFAPAIEAQKVPNPLVPLIKVLVGLKLKLHQFITESLKTNDKQVMAEALKAKWYFDGTKKSITKYRYFANNIFPYVSMTMRREIVKKLALGLANEREAIAEDFFNGLADAYGVRDAVRLLPACSSEFIYEAIITHKIALPNKILKILYFKYPDVALKYLSFTNPCDKKDSIERTMYRLIQPHDYQQFLPHLIRKHPKVFVDLQEVCHTSSSISLKSSKLFLRNSKEILIQRPKDIIDLMPFKLVCNTLTIEEFETMFGNIFEPRWDLFELDDMIYYLEYYPTEKRAILIRSKVEEKYGFDLYEQLDKLTCAFLLLVPTADRFHLARQIVNSRIEIENTDEEHSWWCFLPVQEAISNLKIQIDKSWKTDKKQNLFSQLIYVCKLNEDLNALLQVLEYVEEKQEEEHSNIIFDVVDRVVQEFDIDKLEHEYWKLLFNIIKNIKLKKENAREHWVLIKILKKYVHYCDKNDLDSKEIIDLIVKLFREGRVGLSWILLEDDATFERRYLDANFKSNYPKTATHVKAAITGIYNFNARHELKHSDQRLSIKNYPDLLAELEEIMKKKEDIVNEDESEESMNQREIEQYWIEYAKEIFKEYEPVLYSSWFSEEESSGSNQAGTSEGTPEVKEASVVKKKIFITEAIITLKTKYNYKLIEDDYVRYYEFCKSEMNSSKKHRIKTFLKTLRWYDKVPIKFAELALEQENFSMLAYFIDGETFSKIVMTSLSKEGDVDHNINYLHTRQIATAVRHTTTPIPIDLVEKYMNANFLYTFKNYTVDGIRLWAFIAHNTPVDKLLILSKKLGRVRLFVKRQSIRLVDQAASRTELVSFYSEMWKTKKHPLIQHVIAERIGKLFANRPTKDTWQLVSNCVTEVLFTDDEALHQMIGSKTIPTEYVMAYAEQVLKKVREFTDSGMLKHNAAKFLLQLFGNIRPESCDLLTEDFYKDSIGTYVDSFYESNTSDRFIAKVFLNPNSAHFKERLQFMSELLLKESQKWQQVDFTNRKDTPNFIDTFVQGIIAEVQKFKGNIQLIEALHDIFSNNATLYQHAWAHIMLFFSTIFVHVDQSFKKFGLELSVKIDSLVEKYTREYFMDIVDYAREFVCNFNCYEYSSTIKNRLDFLEGLVESNQMYGLLAAAKLLNLQMVSEFDRQHCSILRKLHECDNPIVRSLL